MATSNERDLTIWQTQLRKGAAELVVLSLLRNDERYGLDLLRDLSDGVGILSDGTLYPLLARLEREGKLIGRWQLDADATPPRKYYRLSNDSRELLDEMWAVWREFSSFVSGKVGAKAPLRN